MRAITLHQPWASLVAIGAKPYETRSFPPPAKLIGQRIAIGAAVKKPDWSALRERVEHDICLALAQACLDPSDLPRGAVVCTAVVSSAFRLGHLNENGNAIITEWRGRTAGAHPLPRAVIVDRFGDYSEGRWAWRLTEVQRLAEPVPAKGKQGWWEWEGLGNG